MEDEAGAADADGTRSASGLPALPESFLTARAQAAGVGADDVRRLIDQFSRFMLGYKFGIDALTTKVRILQQEFKHVHRYNPIEHVSSRLKSPESVLEKVARKGIEPRFDEMYEHITDIAGVRVTCSFVSDVYDVFDLLTKQSDVHVVKVKDYIAHPKTNGYRSLHAIVDLPVFLSTGPQTSRVELQVRTIAMDFWASLEHKIHYKYRGEVPDGLQTSLQEAAATAARLDEEMERLHHDVRGDATSPDGDDSADEGDDGEVAAVELSGLVIARLAQHRADSGEPHA
ncbi:GTP pyrophosphokinase [Propionicicella superfundia]|uniref:GTP pyrophosphokinase n=1 Tax=Propionicicella superfundia TaxID=348582 RepID=UPI0004070BDF|nr:GTP pyrophosphokinase family protein [Propionicicella superfundia]